MVVRTRFAPSPTGYLHIGGVRTALFNWLFARHHGGECVFILRVDDTDAQRNVAEALAPILHGFRWLHLDWDEGAEVGGPHGPYYQSQKQPVYREAVRQLVEKGHAYHDYATADEMAAERAVAEGANRQFVYSRKWMAETPAELARFEAEGRKGVVRLKMPREGACTFADLIRGDMRVEWSNEADHVIQRTDGTCLYNLANVVDDYDMKITHVIRAEEHLSNTPRQIFIARGLGYDLPQYAHVPFVAEPGSKTKLSKRKLKQYLKNPDFKKIADHGQAIANAIGLTTSEECFNPVIGDFYEQVGYLPEAILNYLLLLGWSHPDGKTEMFTLDEMVRIFSLEQVSKGPASFDAKKLFAFQERYMTVLPLEKKLPMVLPYLEKANLIPSPPPPEVVEKVTAIVRAAGERIKVAGDVLDYRDFFTPDDQLPYDEKAFDKFVRKPEAAQFLARCKERLAATPAFDVASLEKTIEAFATAEGVGLGQIVQPLRVALTGKAASFGAFDILAIHGKQRCLARIALALARV